MVRGGVLSSELGHPRVELRTLAPDLGQPRLFEVGRVEALGEQQQVLASIARASSRLPWLASSRARVAVLLSSNNFAF